MWSNIVSDDISDDWGNVDDQEYSGFSSSFIRKKTRILDIIKNRKYMRLKNTHMLNVDEQNLKNIYIKDKNKMKHKLKKWVVIYKIQWYMIKDKLYLVVKKTKNNDKERFTDDIEWLKSLK